MTIRLERPEDYRAVEELTRESFWNVYRPGQLPQFCQSCGMPLTRKEDCGTNADGSTNFDYCCYCYQKGEFPMLKRWRQ